MTIGSRCLGSGCLGLVPIVSRRVYFIKNACPLHTPSEKYEYLDQYPCLFHQIKKVKCLFHPE